MNKQQLASKIWASANKMRSKIEANDYKDYIFGFLFYKFLSDQETRFMLQQGSTDEQLCEYLTEGDAESVEFLQDRIGYFISYDNLYSTWISDASTDKKRGEENRSFSIDNVRVALSAFSRLIGPNHKKVFNGILDTLQSGLSNLGDSDATQTRAVRDLLFLIKDIPTDGKQGYDVLGFVYEFLLENFAANAGKKAGEFYTPHEVSQVMSEIVADHLKHQDEIRIYDPTSGSGSLLLNIGTAISRHLGDKDQIVYYAQELKKNTYNLTRMNLVMRGVKPDNIFARNADTLEDDWPWFDESDKVGTYDPLYVDAVVSNPPYSADWEPDGKESDPRFARFGLAPKSKADYAFLLHELYHLRPDGIMTIVLPHGVLFRGGEEGKIRQALIENNHIDAVIGLPANIFFGTGIPTVVMVLKQKRERSDILIVDASKGFVKNGKDNALRARDIRRIVDTVIGRKTVDKYSRVVSRDEIRENGYNLNIPRYVNSSAPAETWDIYASMFGGIPEHEINALGDYWAALPGLRETLFTLQSNGYAQLSTDDQAEAVAHHTATVSFVRGFSEAFTGFGDSLTDRLVNNRADARLAGEENALAQDVFARLSDVPLVDRYAAYQLLYDQWRIISEDLEMVQTEGEKAIRQVDPRMIVKKVKKVDTEVQDGWAGRILPFDLVQRELLHEETAVLEQAEDDLAASESGLTELVESLSEEDKLDMTIMLNEKTDAFAIGGVNAVINDAKKERKDGDWEDGSPQAVAYQAKKLLTAKTTLAKIVKDGKATLHLKTKTTIENLTDEQVRSLLIAKWVTPLVQQIGDLPNGVIRELTDKVTALAKKYETTFADLEQEIKETEKGLSALVSQLTGSETDVQALTALNELLGGE